MYEVIDAVTTDIGSAVLLLLKRGRLLQIPCFPQDRQEIDAYAMHETAEGNTDIAWSDTCRRVLRPQTDSLAGDR